VRTSSLPTRVALALIAGVVSIAGVLWMPPYASFGLAVIAALSWCWLEAHDAA
jgi:hypothetical protein